MSYDRYERFRRNGKILKVPSVKLSVKSTDYYETYERGKTKLNKLSYDYYGDPNYDWLILMANPSVGSMEYLIPNNTVLRIPYPLNETIEEYKKNIENYNTLYGLG